MVAFEVSRNGKRIAVAGVGPNGVLSTIVTWVGGRRGTSDKRAEDLFLQVGGLIKSEEHVDWTQQSLRVGDVIAIKIATRQAVDRPRKRKRRDPADELRQKKQYVRRLANELGWTVGARKRTTS